MLETIRSLPSASSITPTFDHMAVDTSWERKVLKKVTWLQIPGMCFVRGGDGDFVFHTVLSIHRSWENVPYLLSVICNKDSAILTKRYKI